MHWQVGWERASPFCHGDGFFTLKIRHCLMEPHTDRGDKLGCYDNRHNEMLFIKPELGIAFPAMEYGSPNNNQKRKSTSSHLRYLYLYFTPAEEITNFQNQRSRILSLANPYQSQHKSGAARLRQKGSELKNHLAHFPWANSTPQYISTSLEQLHGPQNQDLTDQNKIVYEGSYVPC